MKVSMGASTGIQVNDMKHTCSVPWQPIKDVPKNIPNHQAQYTFSKNVGLFMCLLISSRRWRYSEASNEISENNNRVDK